MAEDLLSAALAEVRAGLEAAALAFGPPPLDPARASYAAGTLHGNALKALVALDAVLAPHAPRTDVLYGRSCITHRPLTLKPVPDCGACTQDQRREVCPECRDQFGDRAPFGECRARKAVLAALSGKGESGG